MAIDKCTLPSRLCVLRSALNPQTGECATGIFSWTGKSWRTATITALVKALPSTLGDAELKTEYNTFVKAAKARGL